VRPPGARCALAGLSGNSGRLQRRYRGARTTVGLGEGPPLRRGPPFASSCPNNPHRGARNWSRRSDSRATLVRPPPACRPSERLQSDSWAPSGQRHPRRRWCAAVVVVNIARPCFTRHSSRPDTKRALRTSSDAKSAQRRPADLATALASRPQGRVSGTGNPCRTKHHKRRTRDPVLGLNQLANQPSTADGCRLRRRRVSGSGHDTFRTQDRELMPYGSPPRTTESLRASLPGRVPGCFLPRHSAQRAAASTHPGGPGASLNDASIKPPSPSAEPASCSHQSDRLGLKQSSSEAIVEPANPNT
jgi:hypothetical protein